MILKRVIAVCIISLFLCMSIEEFSYAETNAQKIKQVEQKRQVIRAKINSLSKLEKKEFSLKE